MSDIEERFARNGNDGILILGILARFVNETESCGHGEIDLIPEFGPGEF
jgi:hypothetical protein